MPTASPASLIHALSSLKIASGDRGGPDRISLEGLTVAPGTDGRLNIGIERLDAAALQLTAGAFTLHLGRLALRKITGEARIDAGTPRIASLQAAEAELSEVKVEGPLAFPQGAQNGSQAWSLGPLSAADGTLRAEIVDAHLLFDADVTVPIRQGRIDFEIATVEHVGPDSRMGVSRLGLYVDAPNGRSYLYQFPSAQVAGVDYERRDAGASASRRGGLQLQPFVEGVLRRAWAGEGVGITEQARMLLGRTAASGEVQLADGAFAAPGLRADFVGRADGRNAVRLHSEAVGRGLAMEIASLSLANAATRALGMQAGFERATGALLLRLSVDGVQLRFSLQLADVKVSGLRVADDSTRAPVD